MLMLQSKLDKTKNLIYKMGMHLYLNIKSDTKPTLKSITETMLYDLFCIRFRIYFHVVGKMIASIKQPYY